MVVFSVTCPSAMISVPVVSGKVVESAGMIAHCTTMIPNIPEDLTMLLQECKVNQCITAAGMTVVPCCETGSLLYYNSLELVRRKPNNSNGTLASRNSDTS